MSGSASTSVEVGLGIGGNEVGYSSYRPPFTALQWQELEHQAMIYKYMVAGLPVPPDLVTPIRRSFEALSARFFQHPSLGYCSYYGKKVDPEPGRCRRTDGKKWRCSKDSHPDSKYCERHMHRGRNRSRKPVESQNNTTRSLQNIPSPYGSSLAKLQMEPVSYGMDNNKEFRYIQGVTPEDDDHSFSPEASALGLGCNAGSGKWNLMATSQVSSSKSDSQLLGPTSAEQTMASVFEHDSISRQRRQHCFLGNEIGLAGPTKHPFFSEWPMTKESWSALDEDDEPNKNVFSSTQLSISIPRGSSDFSSRSGYSPSDA